MEVHVNLASRDYYDYLPDATIFFATVKQKISLQFLSQCPTCGRNCIIFPALYKYCTAIGTEPNIAFAREETISTDIY